MLTSSYSYSLYNPLSELSTYGQQSLKDTRDQWKAAMGSGVQNLISAGLAGTTMLPSMRLGYARQQSNAMQRVREGLMRMRADYGMQASAQQLQAQQYAQNLALQYAEMAQRGNQFQRQLSYQNPNQIAGAGYVDLNGGGGGYNPGSYTSPTTRYYRDLLSA
jgi:sulfite reductase beta subunit-like hemoprotein